MASPSTSSQSRVVLPSIHEMFPEHLMPRTAPGPAPMSAPGPFPRSHFVPTPPPPQSFSFDVLKSDPRGASLQHIASSRPPPRPSVRTVPPPRAAPSSAHSSSGSSDGDAEMEEDADDDGTDVAGEGKKHVCPTCLKRFNRPSSLRIHVNTHTGATPFRCPHPNCGRAFNVNSNMRRHFRNHASPAFAPPLTPSSLSPMSPVSPAWSTFSPSSAGSYSSGPPTPASPYASPVAMSPSGGAEAKPPWTWAGGAYCESDVRSERR
ncbi:hypothetical protein FB451DRAFT_49653 [Mycena latifolia]|nr:hypothetical protein FB451DRAFT_49653 [Mycena latifolia]